jgi:hypothetical protein
VSGPTFPIFPSLFLLEKTEGFAVGIFAIPNLQVEDMAKFITGKAMPIPNYQCLTPGSSYSFFLDKKNLGCPFLFYI